MWLRPIVEDYHAAFAEEATGGEDVFAHDFVGVPAINMDQTKAPSQSVAVEAGGGSGDDLGQYAVKAPILALELGLAQVPVVCDVLCHAFLGQSPDFLEHITHHQVLAGANAVAQQDRALSVVDADLKQIPENSPSQLQRVDPDE